MSTVPIIHKSRSIFSTYKFWLSSSATISVLLIRFAPSYSIWRSYSWTAATVFLFHALTYLFYILFVYPRFISPLRHLPGPTDNYWFIGQWPTMLKEPSGVPMRRWANEIPNDGLIRYLHLFNRDRLLITSPKALAEVLNTKSYHFVKPDFLRTGIGQILGFGVLFAEGDEHKTQRKNLMPAFNFRHIKELYPIFWDKSREMVLAIEKQIAGPSPNITVEVGEWASRATLDIIGVAGMGQDFNSLADPNTELNRVYRTIFQPNRAAQILGLLHFFLPHFLLRALPVKRNDDVRAACKLARDTSRHLIRQKQALLAEKKELSPDIISIALESGAFTEDALVDNMMTFLAAGHETTASAFTWTIYLLCQNPSVQSQLREEIRNHIPNFSTPTKMNHETIDNMPYLHAVCQEVLRIYAPVPLTIRDTAIPTTILGTYVPAGTKVILSPWAINHNTELWGADAAEFKPSRWMAPGQANAGGAVSNYAFLTFLHGPRSCIGMKFAVAELACLVAAFVGRFEFEMTDKDEVIEIKGGVTARPRNGMRVQCTVLNDWGDDDGVEDGVLGEKQ